MSPTLVSRINLPVFQDACIPSSREPSLLRNGLTSTCATDLLCDDVIFRETNHIVRKHRRKFFVSDRLICLSPRKSEHVLSHSRKDKHVPPRSLKDKHIPPHSRKGSGFLFLKKDTHPPLQTLNFQFSGSPA